MNIATEINELQSLVITLLRYDERLRDSDKKLASRIWSIQLGGLEKVKEMTAYDFFVKYVDDNTILYSHESIGRCRRKLQELHPELRGEKWKERQGHQDDVIEKIRGIVATQEEIKEQKNLADSGLPEWEEGIRKEENNPTLFDTDTNNA